MLGFTLDSFVNGKPTPVAIACFMGPEGFSGQSPKRRATLAPTLLYQTYENGTGCSPGHGFPLAGIPGLSFGQGGVGVRSSSG